MLLPEVVGEQGRELRERVDHRSRLDLVLQDKNDILKDFTFSIGFETWSSPSQALIVDHVSDCALSEMLVHLHHHSSEGIE
jgi:hypothetical protein